MEGPPSAKPPTKPSSTGGGGMDIDYATRSPQILIGVIIPFATASIFVALRLYARAFIVRCWGWDDTFVSVSWFLGLGVTIVATVSTRYGSGMHNDAIPPSSAVPALKLTYADLLLFQATLAMVKFSICLFYLRLFSDRRSRFLIFGTMIFIGCYFLPIEFMDIFQCIPVEGIWNKNISSTCINIHPNFYTMATCNIVGDLWLIAISVPKIWPLKMARRQKIALMCVITSGWLVVVAAILRVVRITASNNSSDRSWTYYDTAIWSGLEISVSLFCVSAPAIKPVLQKYAPGLIASMSQTYSYSFPENAYNNNNNNYVKSNTGVRNGTVTFVNTGERNIGQEEMGLELQDLKNKEPSGKAKANGDLKINRSSSSSKTGNRTFWWDRKGGNGSDSDTESMEEIVPKQELPAGVETPTRGIMKSTSVTVSVEDSKRSMDTRRTRADSSRNHSFDRGDDRIFDGSGVI